MSKRKKRSQSSDTPNLLPIPKTDNQRILLDHLKSKAMTVAVGHAGTGKSYIPSCYAGYLYKAGLIKKIVITRPNTPTGKSLGAFPGEMLDKMYNWVVPILSTLEQQLSKGAVETMIKSGSIELVPFETIRGRSFEDSFVILDEAQNTTVDEMKAFVTRIGEGTSVLINGDVTQSDINKGNNGLSYLLTIIQRNQGLRDKVGVVEFSLEDVVRSELCKEFVKAFNNPLTFA